MNDSANFYLGYFSTLIAEYELRTGRKVGAEWRLVMHQADYAHLDDSGGGGLMQIESALGIPIRAIKGRYLVIVEGKPPENISGRLIIVPPESVERLGVE